MRTMGERFGEGAVLDAGHVRDLDDQPRARADPFQTPPIALAVLWPLWQTPGELSHIAHDLDASAPPLVIEDYLLPGTLAPRQAHLDPPRERFRDARQHVAFHRAIEQGYLVASSRGRTMRFDL